MKIKVAVSACLLGENVRYDGGNKKMELLSYLPAEKYQLIAICPEVEMGLGVPRPAIEIRQIKTRLRLLQVGNHARDFTEQFEQWFAQRVEYFHTFSACILKSKSPSCGLQTTPHFRHNRQFELSDGFFVQKLRTMLPNMPIIDEKQFKITELRNDFILQLNAV